MKTQVGILLIFVPFPCAKISTACDFLSVRLSLTHCSATKVFCSALLFPLHHLINLINQRKFKQSFLFFYPSLLQSYLFVSNSPIISTEEKKTQKAQKGNQGLITNSNAPNPELLFLLLLLLLDSHSFLANCFFGW